MNAHTTHSVLAGSVGAALALASPWALADPPIYRITHIGAPEGPATGVALNDSGQVTGSFVRNGRSLIFLWDGSTLQNFGALGFTFGRATAINASGQVTGFVSDDPADLLSHRIFFWDGNSKRELGEGQGVAINAAGKIAAKIVVDIPNVGFTFHAGLWNGTTVRDLGTLGGIRSEATDVNDAGQVTGSAQNADGVERAFLWDGATMRDLGTLGGSGAIGLAINAVGQVTGGSNTVGGGINAFLWDGTTMQGLGPSSPSFPCVGRDINDFGQVVFECEDLDEDNATVVFVWEGSTRIGLRFGVLRPSAKSINNSGYVTGTGFQNGRNAYIWDGTTAYDVEDLIDRADPLRSRVRLHEGKVINNRGQILADGRLDGVRGHTFVLTPVLNHDLKSLSLNKSEVAGCLNVMGTVALTRAAPTGGLVIQLKDTLAAADVPVTVIVPQGATSKTFTIKTSAVAAVKKGVVGAILGGTSITKDLVVRPIGMKAVTLTPNPVVGGRDVAGTATLECKAGPGPITVNLHSSNTALATPSQAKLVLPVGAQSAAFIVTTSQVAANKSATIRAKANEITKSKLLTVTP